MIVVPAGPIQPYAIVGLGLIRQHLQFDASSLTSTDNNTPGYDIGGGLNIFLAHRRVSRRCQAHRRCDTKPACSATVS
jgi:hypothetical protein